MKVAVKVRLKKSILDPQGKTVHNALLHLGFHDIKDVRIGKLIELTIDDSKSRDEVLQMVEEASHSLLANPVIEDFEIEVEEEDQ
ncbi:MAG: phosphoribosylformylglycinamidine synthase subunit PurS [Calditrichaeota bacterium]|nr:MAG: phosphoribosylformylglycinamidine synthase subunit PurS [Calditrichota bacterium]